MMNTSSQSGCLSGRWAVGLGGAVSVKRNPARQGTQVLPRRRGCIHTFTLELIHTIHESWRPGHNASARARRHLATGAPTRAVGAGRPLLWSGDPPPGPPRSAAPGTLRVLQREASVLKQELDGFRQQRLHAAILRHRKMAQLPRYAGVEIPTDMLQAGTGRAGRAGWRVPAVERSHEFVSHWRRLQNGMT